MRVGSLTLRRFRNIEDMTFVPCEGVNIIVGENAQGKTNILEAIWLFSGARSFRGAKETELVSTGHELCRIRAGFEGGGRDNEVILEYGARRKVLLNGVEQENPAKLERELLLCRLLPGPSLSDQRASRRTEAFRGYGDPSAAAPLLSCHGGLRAHSVPAKRPFEKRIRERRVDADAGCVGSVAGQALVRHRAHQAQLSGEAGSSGFLFLRRPVRAKGKLFDPLPGQRRRH